MPWKFDSHRSSPRTSQSFHCQTSRSLFPGKLQTASRTPPPYIRSNLHSRRDFPPTGVLRSCTNTRHTSLRRIQSTCTSPEISVRTLLSCTFPDRRRKDDGASAWKLGFRRIDTRSPCLLGTSRRRFDCRAPSSIALIQTTRKAQKIQRSSEKKKTFFVVVYVVYVSPVVVFSSPFWCFFSEVLLFSRAKGGGRDFV